MKDGVSLVSNDSIRPHQVAGRYFGTLERSALCWFLIDMDKIKYLQWTGGSNQPIHDEQEEICKAKRRFRGAILERQDLCDVSKTGISSPAAKIGHLLCHA